MNRGKKNDVNFMYLLVIVVMSIIFILSSQPAVTSKAFSNQFIGIYEKVVNRIPFIPHSTKDVFMVKASHYVRKLAHLTIFALLGSIMLVALWQTRLKKNSVFYGLFLAAPSMP